MEEWMDAWEPAGLDLGQFQRTNGVWQVSGAGAFDGHEERYLDVRGREGRLLADEVVRGLPAVPSVHPRAGEWRVRAWSLARLQRCLERRPQLREILDVGCGNGWMAARLAQLLPDRRVLGLDLNQGELEQGARVFAGRPRLAYAHADVMGEAMAAARADLVLLAGSVQYFPDLPSLLTRLCSLLNPGGELQIIDSPFYDDGAVDGARQRSEAYYRGIGCPEMAAHYHHHTWDQLRPFHPDLLHDPRRVLSRLRRRMPGSGESPFPWIRIRG